MKRKILLLPLLLSLGLASCNPSFSDDSRASDDSVVDTSSEEDSEDSTSHDSSDEGDDSSEGQDIDTIVLSWGDDAIDFSDVNGILPGQNHRAGLLRLKASDNYEGRFIVKMEDATTASKSPSDADLIDYLVINVYSGNLDLGNEGELPSAIPVMQITKDTPLVDGNKSCSILVTGTPSGVDYTVFVTLDISASTRFTEMKHDIVSIIADWNAS